MSQALMIVLAMLAAFVAGLLCGGMVARRRTIGACVWKFHVRFRLPLQHIPYVPHADRVRLRLKLLFEELFEAGEAAFDLSDPTLSRSYHEVAKTMQVWSENLPLRVHLPDFVDALCDIDYIVEGTRIEFGVDGWPVLKEVQRANMAKVGGPVRGDGKVMKPPGWVGPQIDTVLYKMGWDGVDGYSDVDGGAAGSGAAANGTQRRQAPPPSAAS